MTIMEAAAAYFQTCLPDWCVTHLHECYGFSDTTIQAGRIGYAPKDRYALSLHLLEAGFSGEEIRRSGLTFEAGCTPVALWRGRIMFPYISAGQVAYFIGRKTEQTTDTLAGKYIKQRRMDGAIQEPIYGADTVVAGKPLIITEGITDALITHQAGYAAISPVTVRFKQERVTEMTKLCTKASAIYLIMDNEENDAGLKGAVDTGLVLARAGLSPYLCTLPRPVGVDKVDLNDFIRTGGDPGDLFPAAVSVEDHPIAEERQAAAVRSVAGALRHDLVRERAARSRKPLSENRRPNLPGVGRVKALLPPITYFTGGAGLVVHPVYGSLTGGNLNVDALKDQWYCFHRGSEGGGDVLKWIAVYELGLIRENEDLRGVAFVKTIRHVVEVYGGRVEVCP